MSTDLLAKLEIAKAAVQEAINAISAVPTVSATPVAAGEGEGSSPKPRIAFLNGVYLAVRYREDGSTWMERVNEDGSPWVDPKPQRTESEIASGITIGPG